MTKQMTVDEIAQKLNVDRQSAYSLLLFLREIGAVVAVNQRTGHRGKPPKLYSFAPNALERVADYLGPLVAGALAETAQAA